MASCPVCQAEAGARRKYCSAACKQKAYRQRQSGPVRNDVTPLRAGQRVTLDTLADRLERIERKLEARPTHHQEALPTRVSLPASPLPTGDLIEFSKPTGKAGNAGRIMLLQVWLSSKVENITIFSLDDLDLVTNHPAFPQKLIEAEKARRAGAASPAIKTIAGSGSVDLTPPNFDDLDLL